MKQKSYTELSGSSFFNIYITNMSKIGGGTWKARLLVTQETPRNKCFGRSGFLNIYAEIFYTISLFSTVGSKV